jgi:hypothetical protein
VYCVLGLRRKHPFVYPIRASEPGRAPPRTAVLVPCFRARGPVRVFRKGWSGDGWSKFAGSKESWWRKIRKFAPEAVAATIDQLRPLAYAKVVGLRNAVIVLRLKNEARLSEADRDWLWDAFRVPVFEQIVGEDGELLATECEAHNGLHIESEKMRTNPKDLSIENLQLLDDDLDFTACPCGRSTPRMFAIRQSDPPVKPETNSGRSTAARA